MSDIKRYAWTGTGLRDASNEHFGPMRFIRETDHDAEIERMRGKLEGLHFHHKMFEPDCRHCQAALAEVK